MLSRGVTCAMTGLVLALGLAACAPAPRPGRRPGGRGINPQPGQPSGRAARQNGRRGPAGLP